ncbi:MAG TPA: NADP oxidoreductase, partial [Bacteroidales bacterium]|nr:NADP oxidoreductase [Bacteroidales bacterium]
MPDKKLKRVDLIFSEDCSCKDVLADGLKSSKEEVLQKILDSGLRGRGGAGFPTGLKWKFTAQQESDEKYVVCNADEGEPGTFKDREILSRVPLKVFGGMTMCAKVIGAKHGYLYLRGEYHFLKNDLQKALDEFHNYLKEMSFDFKIHILMGSGAYICGEESALFESMEGKRGEPRNKPPYPTVAGFRNKPT